MKRWDERGVQGSWVRFVMLPGPEGTGLNLRTRLKPADGLGKAAARRSRFGTPVRVLDSGEYEHMREDCRTEPPFRE